MKRDGISVRQLMVLIVTALLMPATALLPTMTARMAGSAGWLALVGAVPLLLGACWATRGIYQSGWNSIAVGPKALIIIMYLAWTFLVLMVALRLSGARLAEVYGETASTVSVAAMLLVAVWMGVGKLSAFARAGEIFYLALVVLLVGVLLLAAFKIEGANFAVSGEELFALPKSSVATAGLLLNVYPVVVLGRKTFSQKRDGRRIVVWLVVFCIAVALLVGAVIGCLGPRLTGEVPSPFLIMVQGLGIKGAFQRAEALVIALWTLSDLMLTGLMLHTWRELADCLCTGKWSRWSIVLAASAAMIGAWTLFGDVEKLWSFSSRVLPVLGIILGVVCPIVGWFVVCVREKRT